MTEADTGTAAVIHSALRGRSDSELSPEDVPAFAENYRNSMNFYRRHGQEYLAVGDYRQAAEKSWGAFASSVKSIAADYGMKISFHGSIISVSSALATLAGESDPGDRDVLSVGLSSARSLHQHFYENDLPADDVIFSAGRVVEAVDLMQRRFASVASGGGGQGQDHRRQVAFTFAAYLLSPGNRVATLPMPAGGHGPVR